MAVAVTRAAAYRAQPILGFLNSRRFYSSIPSQAPEDLEPDKTDQELHDSRQSDTGTGPKYLSRGKLLAAHRARVIPELRKEDLDETFVRGELFILIYFECTQYPRVKEVAPEDKRSTKLQVACLSSTAQLEYECNVKPRVHGRIIGGLRERSCSKRHVLFKQWCHMYA